MSCFGNRGSLWRGCKSRCRIRGRTEKPGRNILRSVIPEIQHLCLMKSRAGKVEMDDIGI